MVAGFAPVIVRSLIRGSAVVLQAAAALPPFPRKLSTLLFLSCLTLPAGAEAQTVLRKSDPWLIMSGVLLQGLDKITARVSTVEIEVGGTGIYGTLRITLRACRERPPTETPESAAYLEIIDEKPGEAPVALFSGWMFASSPALHALEHPVYDVWVLGCRSASSTAPSSGKE
jgi:hypothetical protein